MTFVCPDHGLFKPTKIGYSYPATGWCPVCGLAVADSDDKIRGCLMFGKSREQQRREAKSERLADAFEEWLEMIFRREFPTESKWSEPWAVTLRNEITLQARTAIYEAAGNTGD